MVKSEWQHSVWVPLLESHSRASHSSFYTWHLFLVLIYVTIPEQINLISTVTCLKQSKLISLLSEEKKLWQEVHRMSFGPSRTNNRQANKKSQRTNLGTLGPRPLGSISLLCRANLILSKGFPILSFWKSESLPESKGLFLSPLSSFSFPFCSSSIGPLAFLYGSPSSPGFPSQRKELRFVTWLLGQTGLSPIPW